MTGHSFPSKRHAAGRMLGLGLWLGIALGLGGVLPASAETTPEGSDSSASEPPYSFEIDSNSRYVWRGVVLSPHEVVQPSVSAAFGGITLSVWGNVGVRGPEATGLDELDGTAGYERSLGGFTLAGAVMLYAYPTDPGAESVELQATLGRDLGAGFNLAAQIGSEVKAYRGALFTGASLTQEASLPAGTLTVAARWGHGSPKFVTAYLSDESRALDLVGGTVSFELQTGGFAVRPHLDVDRPVGASRSLVTEDPPVVFGVAIGRSF